MYNAENRAKTQSVLFAFGVHFAIAPLLCICIVIGKQGSVNCITACAIIRLNSNWSRSWNRYMTINCKMNMNVKYCRLAPFGKIFRWWIYLHIQLRNHLPNFKLLNLKCKLYSSHIFHTKFYSLRSFPFAKRKTFNFLLVSKFHWENEKSDF